MANATTYFRNKLIDQWLRAQPVVIPATLYMTVLKGNPTATGALAQEVSLGSYARVAILSSLSSWTAGIAAGDAQRSSNGGAVTFPSPTADWGTVTHGGLIDSATLGAGNMLIFWELGTPRTILNGDNPPSFAIGTLTIDWS